MVDWPSLLGAVGVVVLAAGMLAWRPLCRAWRRPRFDEARRRFHWERERLEAKFLRLRHVQRQPDEAPWVACEFEDEVAYVRNRVTGELSAFVGVSVVLDPSDSSHTPAPDDLAEFDPFVTIASRPGRLVREATAVFRLDRDRWDTDGRVIFNLTPSETIRFYRHDLEILGREPADPSWSL